MHRLRWCLLSLPLAVLVIQAAETDPAGEIHSKNFRAIETALRRDNPAAAFQQAKPLAEAGDAEAQFVVGLLQDIGAGARLDHEQALVWLEKAAPNYALARHYLRWRFETSFGLEKPDPAATAHWREAATGTPSLERPWSRWLDVRDGRLVPNFARAFLWMMDRARDGDVVAQANLAEVYLVSQWTAPDTGQHLYWLRLAGNNKDAASLERLATYSEYGLLLPKDSAQALVDRRAAAAAGSAAAQFALGEQYADGDGLDQDPVEALKWFRLAAAQDHVEALVKLGDLLRDGAPGVPQDFAASLEAARRAAALGNLEAMGDVAGMMRNGQGTPKDPAGAAKLYEQAARMGYAYAADMLGWMYQEGKLGAPDFATARHWFEQAAQKNNEHAMRQIGLMYRDAKGVPKDQAKAFEWFERAAREGDAWSQNEVGWMLRQGLGIDRDDEEAVTWFRLAAQHGEPLGEANLGYHYLNGLGVEKDPLEAVRHLIAAARELDDPWVQSNFLRAVANASVDARSALRSLLEGVAAEPDLLTSRGMLPELCLMALETGPAANQSAARGLLERLASGHRPSSLLTLAQHAFLGHNMPCDIEQARAWLRELAGMQPGAAALFLAQIDSVAAPTADERATAQATLQRLADNGDPGAAWVVAGRILDGIGYEPDPELARKYLEIVFAHQSGASTHSAEIIRKMTEQRTLAPPSPESLAQQIEELRSKHPGDAALTVLFRAPAAYPRELSASAVTGSADIQFTVGIDGMPTDVHAKSGTHPLFAAAAEAAIKRWRFAPARKNGKPISTRAIQTLQFSLQESVIEPAVVFPTQTLQLPP